MATSPRRTVRIEMTMATTGRLMKKRAMSLLVPRGGGRRVGAAGGRFGSDDRGTRLHARESFHDHAISRLQSRVDDPESAGSFTGYDLADVGLAIRANDGDLVSPLQLVDGSLRDEDGVFLHLDDCPHFRVLTGSQHIAGVREQPDGRDRAGFDVDLAP